MACGTEVGHKSRQMDGIQRDRPRFVPIPAVFLTHGHDGTSLMVVTHDSGGAHEVKE